MSDDQPTAMKWTIRINDTELTNVAPGETVEIGRKPIRPLPDDGTKRVEILDDTRSMSKRHAQFTVKSDGAAVLRDLNSTNGTYLVKAGSELRRLPENVDFVLSEDTVRIQFGDVPVDFIKYIETEQDETGESQVVNLFDYAMDTPAQDNKDLSVDEILNLRAGEPTDIFTSSSVVNRARELHNAEQQSFAPFAQPLEPLNLQGSDEDAGSESRPRDLFMDAQNITPDEREEVEQEPTFNEHDGKPKHKNPFSHEFMQVKPAVSAEEDEDSEFEETELGTPDGQANSGEAAAEAVEKVQETQTTETVPAENNTTQESEPAEPAETEPAETESAEEKQSSEPAESTEQSESTETAQDESAYTPAFEPGSVFDRLSRGELNKNEEIVEVEGFTSDQARRSEDFAEQFEMARHSELLPFLAMNVSLYDDLYAWLAAQGDADIDEALSRNSGYEDYRKAVGK